MPRYSTATTLSSGRKTGKKKRQKLPKRLPRDPRKLLSWAHRGTAVDYERLRTLARKLRDTAPPFIERDAYDRLLNIDKPLLIEEIQAHEQHDVSAGYFLDAINWLLDKVPWGNWIWPVSAAQSVINAQKGDSLNEVDELYARLVGATYGRIDGRPFVLDHWRRQTQFDGAYISVWDNPDGHRVICVRGTQGTAADIAQDILVGVTGKPLNLLGKELLSILAATPDDVVIDLAAHSLGTALALQSYSQSSTTYERIHETYLYNPAYSPLLRGAADAYERDTNVRYFINLNDVVSMGSFGHRAPRNVVYKTNGSARTGHQIAQWQGSGVHTPQYHSPPETKIPAKKAVDPEHKVDPEGSPETAAGAAEIVQVHEFDFGHEQSFDYAAL